MASIPTLLRDDRRFSELSAQPFKTHFLTVLWCWAHDTDEFQISRVRGDHSELIDKGLWTPLGDGVTYRIEGAPQVGANLAQSGANAPTQTGATSGANSRKVRQIAGISFSSYSLEFEKFWKIYPHRKDKRKAQLAFDRALQRAPLETILAGARAYAGDPDRKTEFTKYAEGWLNGDRWLDEAPVPAPPKPSPYDALPDYDSYLRGGS